MGSTFTLTDEQKKLAAQVKSGNESAPETAGTFRLTDGQRELARQTAAAGTKRVLGVGAAGASALAAVAADGRGVLSRTKGSSAAPAGVPAGGWSGVIHPLPDVGEMMGMKSRQEYAQEKELDGRLSENRTQLAMAKTVRDGYSGSTQADAAERLDAAEREVARLETEAAALEKARSELERETQSRYYGSLYRASDFGRLSVPDAAHEAEGQTLSGGVDLYAFINDMGDARQTVAANYERGPTALYGDWTAYTYLTDDERKIYNYLYAKRGGEQAQGYLDFLQETLNARHGGELAANVRGKDSAPERALAAVLYGITAGLDQNRSGMAQVFHSGRLPTSAVQYGSAAIREDLADAGPKILGSSLGQLGYDAVTTTANMAPGILLSAAAGGLGLPGMLARGLGSLQMGVSAGGSAYNQALADGYTKEQAREYGTLIGAAEGGLQYLLGGIGKLGGVSERLLAAKIQGIDSALARMALTGAVKLGSEVTEEELQLWIEPALRTLLFEEEFNAPTFADAAYTALLTAVTTGVLESGEIARSGRSKTKLNMVDNAETPVYNQIIIGGEANGRAGSNAQNRGGILGRERPLAEMASGGEQPGGSVPGSGIVRISPESQQTFIQRGVVHVELQDYSTDGAAFSSALDEARNADAANGWAVTPKSPQELAESGVRTFMDANGSTGFGIAPDGDIEAVFANHSKGAPKKSTYSVIPQAIANGGTKLDCYGEKLVDVYARFGFVPVARVEFNPEYANPGWTPDKGTPYIYFLMHNGDSADTVVQRTGTYKQYSPDELNALPTYGRDDYDAAYAYRDGLLVQSGRRTAQAHGAQMAAQNPAAAANGRADVGIVPYGAGSGKEKTASTGETEGKTLVQRIQEAIPQMKNAAPVANISGNELPKAGTMVERIMAFVNSIGNKVNRPGFGDVLFSRGKIKSSMIGHGVGNAKIETFAAVPAVIQSGQQIDYQQNWKGRNYDTYTFMAPITYHRQTDYLGVIVQKDSASNRYYLHEVVDKSGNVLYKNKETPLSAPDGTSALAGDLDTVANNGASSDPTIPRNTDGVKTEYAQNDAKDTAPEGMGAASAGFDPYSSWQNSSASFHPPGENPARAVDLPMADAQGRSTSATAVTAMEAAATPDRMVPRIEEMAADGSFSYDRITNEQTLAAAREKLVQDGFSAALVKWRESLNHGFASAEKTVLGWALYNEAANANDANAALQILSDIAAWQRGNAQSLQAQRILKRMTPEGQLYAAQQTVDRLQRQIDERKAGKKGNSGETKLHIDEDLAQQFLAAGTQEERDGILFEIYRDIGRQTPSTFLEKWNAWRYLSMLGNARTHVRNLAGNLAHAAARAAAEPLSAVGERMFIRDRGSRTKSVFVSRDMLKRAKADYANVADAILGGGKYENNTGSDAISRAFSEGHRVFGKPLRESHSPVNLLANAAEALRRGNSALLDREDVLFSRPAYARALAGFLTARGLDFETASQAQLDEARAYAVKEAQKATYRDLNAFSALISELRVDTNRNRTGTKAEAAARQAANALTEGVLPFKKTPANILVRAVELSPVGLANGIKQALWDVRRGKTDAATAISSMAYGLTGTGILMLGALLRGLGYVTGGEDDDEKQGRLNDAAGHQNYALEIGGKSFTLDWLAPEALPFFVGAEMYDAFQDGSASVWDVLKALGRTAEPMLEMSMLQSLNELFASARSGDGGLTRAAATMATSYFTQGIPTILGQTARTLDGTRRASYTDPNSETPDSVQYLLQTVMGKIPGLENRKKAYVDMFGNEENTGAWPARFVNNFLNPAYISDIENTALTDEMQRLYDGGYDVVPPAVPKTVSCDGQTYAMTASENEAYAKTRGKTLDALASALIGEPFYAVMSDAQREKAFESVNAYAADRAKKELVESRGGTYESEWDDEAEMAKPAQYLAGKAAFSVAIDARDYDAIDALTGSFTDIDQIYRHKLTEENSTIDALISSAQQGIDAETWFQANDAVRAATEKAGNTKSATKFAGLVQSGLNEREIDKLAPDYLAEKQLALYSAARGTGMTAQEALALWNTADADKNGQLTQVELYAALSGVPEQDRPAIWDILGSKTGYGEYRP